MTLQVVNIGTAANDGTGDPLRTAFDKINDNFAQMPGPVVSVMDPTYGAVGDGATDDSVAIQAAINTGLSVFFPEGNYLAHGLTQTTNSQRLFATGNAQLIKNANGTILACTGANVQLYNLQFRGESATPTYTGNNVTFTGDFCGMLNCGSRWAFGRAVKATGNRFQILGTCDIYQTADQTATGYDIEIGVSGTATLYHHLWGVDSAQSTGGILFVDCGGQAVEGGHFGKLNISSGTSPAGVNGGMYLGNRILGDVTVGISNANFAANSFGIVAVTINATVTGVSIDESNTFQAGSTLVNNGGGSNPLVRSVGASGTIKFKYGHDASVATLDIDHSLGRFVFGTGGNTAVVVPNNSAGFRILSSTGTDGATINQSSGDDMSINNNVTDHTITYHTTGTNSGSRHQFSVNGTMKLTCMNDGVHIGNTTAPFLSSGTGTPEGAVTAPVGSVFLRTDAATSLYVKQTGAGNTGWVAK